MTTPLIGLQAQFNNSYFLKSNPQKEVYLYINLKSGTPPTKQERLPLNISLVVDRSGSMSGPKLNYVKKAVDFVIDHLAPTDYLSIVQYDNKVDVVSPASKVTNKTVLHQKVSEIQARGMTNLSGGMLEGYNQVNKTQATGLVNRVLLLSDGLANQGVTDPEKLQTIAQKKFRDKGIGLSTFGVGSDFNEQLMTNLSEYGGSNYYFIDEPDKIPAIFAEELQGLLSVVAQNAKLNITYPHHYLRCTKVFGFPHTQQGNQLQVNFNDIFASEEKAVLVKFELLQNITQPLDFQLNCQFDDVANSLDTITLSEKLTIQPTTSKKEYEAGINHKAVENVALYQANAWMEEAILLADKNKFEKAKVVIAKAKAYLEAYVQVYVNSIELKTQLEQVTNYARKLENMGTMDSMERGITQKMSKSSNYYSRKRKVALYTKFNKSED